MNEKQRMVAAFIRFLKKTAKTDNRGVLADLRRGFSDATAIRVWPHIGKFCGSETERLVFRTVAACYATNPLNDADNKSNFGTSARKLKAAFPTFETTFQRLLNCRRREDVCKRLQGVALAMKAKNVAVNWKRLTWDLLCWNNRVKARWAEEFWPVGDFVYFEERESVAEAENEDNEGGDE